MSWMTYYVEVSTRQREDETARRIARQRELKRLARAPRRHWWSLRRSAPVTRTPTVGGEVACRRAASLPSAPNRAGRRGEATLPTSSAW